MRIAIDIFAAIGLYFLWGGLVLVVLMLFHARENRSCITPGCRRAPMPGWRVCMVCRNQKTEPSPTAGFQSLRDAS